jgi:hypothetical protein
VVVSTDSIGGVALVSTAGGTRPVDYLRDGTRLYVDCLQVVNPTYLQARISDGPFASRWIDALSVRTIGNEDLRKVRPVLPFCGPAVEIDASRIVQPVEAAKVATPTLEAEISVMSNDADRLVLALGVADRLFPYQHRFSLPTESESVKVVLGDGHGEIPPGGSRAFSLILYRCERQEVDRILDRTRQESSDNWAGYDAGVFDQCDQLDLRTVTRIG